MCFLLKNRIFQCHVSFQGYTNYIYVGTVDILASRYQPQGANLQTCSTEFQLDIWMYDPGEVVKKTFLFHGPLA